MKIIIKWHSQTSLVTNYQDPKKKKSQTFQTKVILMSKSPKCVTVFTKHNQHPKRTGNQEECKYTMNQNDKQLWWLRREIRTKETGKWSETNQKSMTMKLTNMTSITNMTHKHIIIILNQKSKLLYWLCFMNRPLKINSDPSCALCCATFIIMLISSTF